MITACSGGSSSSGGPSAGAGGSTGSTTTTSGTVYLGDLDENSEQERSPVLLTSQVDELLGLLKDSGVSD